MKVSNFLHFLAEGQESANILNSIHVVDTVSTRGGKYKHKTSFFCLVFMTHKWVFLPIFIECAVTTKYTYWKPLEVFLQIQLCSQKEVGSCGYSERQNISLWNRLPYLKKIYFIVFLLFDRKYVCHQNRLRSFHLDRNSEAVCNFS